MSPPPERRRRLNIVHSIYKLLHNVVVRILKPSSVEQRFYAERIERPSRLVVLRRRRRQIDAGFRDRGTVHGVVPARGAEALGLGPRIAHDVDVAVAVQDIGTPLVQVLAFQRD